MTFTGSHIDLPYHPADLDTKFEIVEDPENNIFEPSILSASTMERKDSYATNSTFFSPQSATMPWGDDSFPAISNAKPSMSSQMADSSIPRNPFMQQQNFNNWAVYDAGPESKPPMPAVVYESFLGEFEQNSNGFPNATAPSPYLSTPAMIVRPSAVMQSTSPPIYPSTEWMGLVEHEMGSERLPKRLRQHSPQRPLTPGFASREGVRKKNARFDIPEGRSLATIDKLIAAASCDEDIKELKQQKRLLRNRQAALDSRQRKKKHTEDLEKEQKLWQDDRNELSVKLTQVEEELAQMRLQQEQLEQHNHDLLAQVHALSHDKEIMVEQHTLETGDLRKRISVLQERIERSPATTHSHSTDFTDLDLENLTMDNDWEDSLFSNILEDDEINYTPAGVPSTTLVVGKPRKDHLVEDMQPFASGGFLLMLLLYGAFVASKSGSNAPQMPGMSDEMRVASAHLVDNILKDGNTGSTSLNFATASRMNTVQPAPSMPAWIQPNTPSKVSGLNLKIMSQNGRPSHLSNLQNSMLTASKNAEDEAAFGLSAEQYNSMTTSDNYGPSRTFLPDEHLDATPMRAPRKSLGEALRQMRQESGAGQVFDVYTRSLLWDKIPEDVLTEFRRMVDERREESEGIKQESS